MNTEPWVTASEVAQHLGVVKDTVYRWRERKGLPAHKIGSRMNSFVSLILQNSTPSPNMLLQSATKY